MSAGLALGLCSVLAVAGCGRAASGTHVPSVATEGWQELPGSPLGPRQGVLGLWTGREVLLIGGSDETPCPPLADCPADPTPLVDGAAVDPETGRWRRIADAPSPVRSASAVMVGQTAYILPTEASGPAGGDLLAYLADQDRWQRIPVPFDRTAGYRLSAAGDRLVAYLGSDEAGSGSDFLRDPAAGDWTPLPQDPLGRSFDRAMVWTGRELVLFDHELVPNPGADKPAITRAAALDLTASSWRRLPDSTILSTEPWLLAGGRLINPTLGGADGGQVGNWGRRYPYGGVLDPPSGRWSVLPGPPAGIERSAGARTATTAVYIDVTGAILDTATSSWSPVPPLPGAELTGPTVLAAGTAMLTFGGARWQTPTAGTLTNNCWIWRPAT